MGPSSQVFIANSIVEGARLVLEIVLRPKHIAGRYPAVWALRQMGSLHASSPRQFAFAVLQTALLPREAWNCGRFWPFGGSWSASFSGSSCSGLGVYYIVVRVLQHWQKFGQDTRLGL